MKGRDQDDRHQEVHHVQVGHRLQRIEMLGFGRFVRVRVAAEDAEGVPLWPARRSVWRCPAVLARSATSCRRRCWRRRRLRRPRSAPRRRCCECARRGRTRRAAASDSAKCRLIPVTPSTSTSSALVECQMRIHAGDQIGAPSHVSFGGGGWPRYGRRHAPAGCPSSRRRPRAPPCRARDAAWRRARRSSTG